MKHSIRVFIGIAAIAGAFWDAAVIARADTWNLELKRLDSQGRGGMVFNAADYLYRATSPQGFFVQLGPKRDGVVGPGDPRQKEAFQRIVTKEPPYESAEPFRGVAKLGSQEFAFALDYVPTKAEADKKKAEAEGGKPKDEKAESGDKGAKDKSALRELQEKLVQETTVPEVPSPQGFNRLYFDANHNGDLTDDPVVTGVGQAVNMVVPRSYVQISFPRVDVALDVEGTKVDYAFVLSGHVNASKDYSYASIQLSAAAYREGDITLDGKQRRVAVIDSNSNGRFDDQMKVIMINRGMGKPQEAYPQDGDVMLLDPDVKTAMGDSPYDVTGSKNRHYVSSLINIDDRYYDLKVSPAGDQVTLAPSDAALGNITNPNGKFRAVIYQDKCILKIAGDEGKPIAVPEGEWKLLSYTLDRTGVQEPAPPAKPKAEQEPATLLGALAKTAEAILGSGVQPGERYRRSFVAANASSAYKAVKVTKGETVELPFGPPFKPLVTAYSSGNANLEMELSLVGSTGEICSNMMVDNSRPGKPKFTITDLDGKVVQEGSFEYG